MSEAAPTSSSNDGSMEGGGSDKNDEAVSELKTIKSAFKNIEGEYRLIDKIGEGTFSSVYKAEDLNYHLYENSWDVEFKDASRWSSPPVKRSKIQNFQSRDRKYVAIKKIYVTSSPARIINELELLSDLAGCESVVPLITAFRKDDQVLAVLPYFQHVEFRDYFSIMSQLDIRFYFRSLFTALHHVHTNGIIHRDIKPSNFLYDMIKRKGVLVDFGLAEREACNWARPTCACLQSPSQNQSSKINAHPPPSSYYLKNDARSAKRANRAGTRGFRAPEILFKCTEQNTKIDTWSAGVILLSILTKRFPFFNSIDDTEALLEIATIFGRAKTRECATQHGCSFETSIPTIHEKGHSITRLIEWAHSMQPQTYVPSTQEAATIDFMQNLLDLNYARRFSAEETLHHSFLANIDEDELIDDAVSLC